MKPSEGAPVTMISEDASGLSLSLQDLRRADVPELSNCSKSGHIRAQSDFAACGTRDVQAAQEAVRADDEVGLSG